MIRRLSIRPAAKLPDDSLTHRACPRCGGSRLILIGTPIETRCPYYRRQIDAVSNESTDDDSVTSTMVGTPPRGHDVPRNGGQRPRKKVLGGYI
jgi:hypothetical protein